MHKTQRFLYRYYSNRDFILDVVKKKQLYHCTPSQLNDPFECRPLISLKYDPNIGEETWRKLFYYLVKMAEEDDSVSESEIRKRADACLEAGLHKNQARLDDYCTAIRDQANDQRSMVRVCCFAKSIRNMMLWAHYANKQKGVAFQFLKSELKDKNTQ